MVKTALSHQHRVPALQAPIVSMCLLVLIAVTARLAMRQFKGPMEGNLAYPSTTAKSTMEGAMLQIQIAYQLGQEKACALAMKVFDISELLNEGTSKP